MLPAKTLNCPTAILHQTTPALHNPFTTRPHQTFTLSPRLPAPCTISPLYCENDREELLAKGEEKHKGVLVVGSRVQEQVLCVQDEIGSSGTTHL